MPKGKCNKGETKCGVDADSLFCVPEGEQCPINSVYWNELPKENISDFKHIALAGDSFIYFSNKTDNYPLADLHIEVPDIKNDYPLLHA